MLRVEASRALDAQPAEAHAAFAAEEAALAQRGAEIQRHLDEVEACVAAHHFSRVEALLRAVVDWYGIGLERLLEHARVTASLDFERRLASDGLVAGLLTLHGLHALGVEERVQLALEAALGVEAGSEQPGQVSFQCAGGVVTLRGPLADSQLPRIARSIQDRVPEITDVRWSSPATASRLIPVERLTLGPRR